MKLVVELSGVAKAKRRWVGDGGFDSHLDRRELLDVVRLGVRRREPCRITLEQHAQFEELLDLLWVQLTILAPRFS